MAAANTVFALDFHQDWTQYGQECGLEWVDGWDERSKMRGTMEQWRETWQHIARATAHHKGSDKRRRTAVLTRIGNNIAARLNIHRR